MNDRPAGPHPLTAFGLMLLLGPFAQVQRAQADPGVTADRVLFGQSVNLTGASPAANAEFRAGFDIYVDKVNHEGGVHGRKISVTRADDSFEPAKAVTNTTKFITEDKVFALYGYNGAPLAKAVLPIVDRENIPFIAPFTGMEVVRTPLNPNIFNFRAGAIEESESLVSYALDKLGISGLGVFYQNDAFGQAGKATVEKVLFRRGMSLKASASYQRNNMDVDAAVAQLQAAGVKAVITWATFLPAALFIKKAHERGFDPVFLCSSNAASLEFLSKGGKAVEGATVTFVVPPPGMKGSELLTSFERDARAAGHDKYDSFTEEGYMNAVILVEGLRRAGTALTRAGLRKAFESMTNERIQGLKVTLGPSDHQALDYVFLAQVKDGKFVHLPFEVKPGKSP